MEYKNSKHHEEMNQKNDYFSELELKVPSMYEVILLADDEITMELTIDIFKEFFHKSNEDAQYLSIQMQQTGKATSGVFTRDIAETKILDVTEFLQRNEYPIKCIMQKEQ